MNTEAIIQDYQNKLYTKDIQIKYKISWKRLTKILQEAGVYRKSNSLHYSESIIEYLKNNYYIQESKSIAKHLGISEDHIQATIKKLGMPLKGSGWKYRPEIDNFDTSTREFSYFLGWMASDGNVSKDLRTSKLVLSDKEVVDKFLEMFPMANYYTYQGTVKMMHHLSINSMTFARTIGTFGIHPAKSRTLDIKKELITPDFIRGFFEGDGHIRKDSKRCEGGFVCASEKFTDTFVSVLQEFGIKITKSKDQSFFRMRFNGKENIKNFYNLIYNDCGGWYLKRKKEIFDNLFQSWAEKK